VVSKKEHSVAKAHRKECLHCGFIWLTKKKYPDWAAAGRKPHPQDEEVRKDMMLSVAHLAGDVMRGMDAEGKKKFIASMEMAARPPGEMLSELLNSFFATKQ
jgi:hypothetical protein